MAAMSAAAAAAYQAISKIGTASAATPGMTAGPVRLERGGKVSVTAASSWRHEAANREAVRHDQYVL